MPDTETTAAWAGDASSLTLVVLAREAEARKLPVDDMLGSCGVDRFTLWNPAGRVRRAAVFAFAEDAVLRSRDPLFHVTATAKAALGAFGLLDYIVTLAATVGEGIERIAPAYALINAGLKLRVRRDASGGVCDVEALFETQAHWCELETLVVAGHARTRSITGGEHGLSSVALCLPDRGHARRMAEVLGCPVTYDAPRTLLRWSTEAWRTPSQIAHPGLLPLLGLTGRVTASLAERVSDVLMSILGTRETGAAEVARTLGLSERTLHRKLAQEHTSFRAVLVDVRDKLAAQYKRAGTLSTAEIAVLLGYSSASAYRRAAGRSRRTSDPSDG